MLWNEIYEFFVKYVFGGLLWDYDLAEPVAFPSFFGAYSTDVSGEGYVDCYEVNFLNYSTEYGSFSLSFGNYLSLISTIITMVAIVLFCVFIIKKIIGIIFRLFTGSSAF